MQRLNYYLVNIVMGLVALIVATTWLIGVPTFICRVGASALIPADIIFSSLAVALCGVVPCAWSASVVLTYYDNQKRNMDKDTPCIVREKSLWLILGIVSNIILSIALLYLAKHRVDLQVHLFDPTFEVWVIGGLTVFWLLIFCHNRRDVSE